MGIFRIGKSRDQRFADFAERACQSQQEITVKLSEVYPLVLAIESALMKTQGLESREAFNKASNDVRLTCPKCGEYNNDAKDVVLLGGQGGAFEQMQGVTFGGPTIAALGQGRCPGCKGTKAIASFDPNPSGVAELRRAVADRNLSRIREILNNGVDVNETHPMDGSTSLTYAAEKGFADVAELLLETGASPNKYREGADAIPLVLAAMNDHIEVVRLLLDAGADANVRESNNLTALHFAAVEGHVDVVKALLAAGANPEAKPTDDGWTPLFYAIEKGQEEVVDALLRGGADPNSSNKDGISPLLYAATKGRADNIQQLLREAGGKS